MLFNAYREDIVRMVAERIGWLEFRRLLEVILAAIRRNRVGDSQLRVLLELPPGATVAGRQAPSVAK